DKSDNWFERAVRESEEFRELIKKAVRAGTGCYFVVGYKTFRNVSVRSRTETYTSLGAGAHLIVANDASLALSVANASLPTDVLNSSAAVAHNRVSSTVTSFEQTGEGAYGVQYRKLRWKWHPLRKTGAEEAVLEEGDRWKNRWNFRSDSTRSGS